MVRLAPPIILLVLGLLALPAVFGETLYKWVDDQGNVHYSDKPQPGAKKIHLAAPSTFKASGTAAPPAAASQTNGPTTGYSAFQIGSPTPDQVFWNVQSVTVSVAIQPGLHPGDLVTITVDGQTQGPGTALSYTFDDLYRGEHTANATLQETDGSSMIAKPVTFYIQRGTQKGLHKVMAH
jgi:hypothetical protein